jgi:hypothetical protein
MMCGTFDMKFQVNGGAGEVAEWKDSLSEETATQTPRSSPPTVPSDGTLSPSLRDSPNISPRSSVDSDGGQEHESEEFHESDSGDSNDGASQSYEEYYDFLRDFAGSFEAERSEGGDDSDVDSENEASDEETGRQGADVGDRACDPPTCYCGGATLSPTTAPPPSVAALLASTLPRSQVLGPQGVSPCGSAGIAKDNSETTAYTVHGGQNSSAAAALPTAVALGTTGRPPTASVGPRPALVPQLRQLATPPARSCGTVVVEAVKKDIVWNTLDNRAPMVDDYDVSAAVDEYAMQHPQGEIERKRECLLDSIKMRSAQMRCLAGQAKNQHLATKLRDHYARVRAELAEEVGMLELQLVELEREATTSPSGVPVIGVGSCGPGSIDVAVQ